MELLLYLVIAGAVAGFGYLQARKMQGAMRAKISDDECVACQSRELTYLAQGIYRCDGCGYEGGSGVARRDDESRRRALQALSPEARRQKGVASLLEARTILLGARADLKQARSLSTTDLIGRSGDQGQEKQREITRGTGELLRAQQCLRDASECLGHTSGDPGELAVDFTGAAFALDVSFDSIFLDLKVHAAVKKMIAHADAMNAAVEQALRQAGVPFQGDSG